MCRVAIAMPLKVCDVICMRHKQYTSIEHIEATVYGLFVGFCVAISLVAGF